VSDNHFNYIKYDSNGEYRKRPEMQVDENENFTASMISEVPEKLAMKEPAAHQNNGHKII